MFEYEVNGHCSLILGCNYTACFSVLEKHPTFSIVSCTCDGKFFHLSHWSHVYAEGVHCGPKLPALHELRILDFCNSAVKGGKCHVAKNN